MKDGSETAQEALVVALAADSKAERALEKQDSHEDVCAERYKGINETLSEIKVEIKTMQGNQMKALGFLVFLLLGVVGFLAAPFFGGS